MDDPDQSGLPKERAPFPEEPALLDFGLQNDAVGGDSPSEDDQKHRDRPWIKWPPLVAAFFVIVTGTFAIADRCTTKSCENEILPNCSIRLAWPTERGRVTNALVVRRGERRELALESGRIIVAECPECPVAAERLEIHTSNGGYYVFEGVILDARSRSVVLTKADVDDAEVRPPEQKPPIPRQAPTVSNAAPSYRNPPISKAQTEVSEPKPGNVLSPLLAEQDPSILTDATPSPFESPLPVPVAAPDENNSTGPSNELPPNPAVEIVCPAPTAHISESQTRIASQYLLAKSEVIAFLAHSTLTLEEANVVAKRGGAIMLKMAYGPSAALGNRYTTYICYDFGSSGLASTPVIYDDAPFGAFTHLELIKSVATDAISSLPAEANEDAHAVAQSLETALASDTPGSQLHYLLLQLDWFSNDLSVLYPSL